MKTMNASTIKPAIVSEFVPEHDDETTLQELLECNHEPTKQEKSAGVIYKIAKCQLPEGFYHCWVKSGVILPDSHQRPIVDSHIASIMSKWNPAFFSMPILTCRSDSKEYPGMHLFVEEGQHSVKVANHMKATTNIAGYGPSLEALVAFGKDKYFGASVSYHANRGKRKQKPWESFGAAWAAKMKPHVHIVQLLEKYGLTNPVTNAKMPLLKLDATLAQQYINLYKDDGKFLEKMFKFHSLTFKGQHHNKPFYLGLAAVIRDEGVTSAMVKAMSDKDVVSKIGKMAQEIAMEESNVTGKETKVHEGEYTKAIKKWLGITAD